MRLWFFFSILVSLCFAQPKLVFMQETADGKKQIVLANSDGSDPDVISTGTDWHLYPTITADARTVAYAKGNQQSGVLNFSIVLQDLHTGKEVSLTKSNGLQLHPVFSGDGRKLAFSGPEGVKGKAQIVVIELATRKTSIIKSNAPGFFPALTSDGSQLVFQENRKGAKVIVRHDIESGKNEDLTAPNETCMAPSLSFDDDKVLYTKKMNSNWDVYLLELSSKKETRLTQDKAKDFAPTFRPDGSVVFASDRLGNFALYEISAEDIRKQNFTPTLLVETKDSDLYAPSVSGESYRQDELAKMLNPSRSSFGAVRLGDRVYVVGGHQGPEHTYPKESFMDATEAYDLKKKNWVKLAPRPVKAHGFGLAAYGKYVYAFGGFAFSDKHNPGWKSLSRIDRYDTETNTWKHVGDLPRNRSSNVVAKVGENVYLIAGWDSTPKHDKDLEGRFHKEIDVFHLRTETVSANEFTLPNPLRRALSAVVKGEEIILMGGISKGASHFDLLDSVTSFHTHTQKWSELPKLPFATFAPAAGIIKNEMMIFGGMFKTGPMQYVYVNHVYRLKEGEPRWQHTGRYLGETKGFSQVVDLPDSNLGILGGHNYEQKDAPVPTFETFGFAHK